MYLTLYPNSINTKHIQAAVTVLKKGGLLIYPTDTVYAIGCLCNHPAALKKLAQLKEVKLEKANFSFLFEDFTSLSKYVKPMDTSTFRLLNRLLPGPFTFILPAQHRIPKPFHKRKTLGVRIVNHPVLHELLPLLSVPLITTSLHDEDKIKDYTTAPDEIYAKWEGKVDMMLDCGTGGNIPSTIIDCTTLTPEVLRQGKGVFEV